MKRTSLGDLSVAYDDVGEGGERPFVLLHGFTGCRADWDQSLPELATWGRTLAPDLRGHGDSTNTGRAGDYHVDQLVEDLAGFLDALGVGRCDLLGHSFGARIALRFALTRPERVASLVLMNAATNAYPPEKLALFEKAWAIARARGMEFLQGLVEKAARANPEPGPDDRILDAWSVSYWDHHRKRHLAMDPEAYAELGRELAVEERTLDRLGELACPVLVLVGEHDVDQLAAAERLARGIPAARSVILPGAGHHPQRENPVGWLAALREHLEAARGSASTPRDAAISG